MGRRERHGGAGAVGRGAGHRAAGGGGPASPLIDDRVITVRVVREDLYSYFLMGKSKAEVMVVRRCAPQFSHSFFCFVFRFKKSAHRTLLYLFSTH